MLQAQPKISLFLLFIGKESWLDSLSHLASEVTELSAGPARAQHLHFLCCFRPGEAQEPRVPLGIFITQLCLCISEPAESLCFVCLCACSSGV